MYRRSVLVIRANDRFSDLLRESGFDVLNLELIKTEPIADQSDLSVTVGRISEYDGILITSPVAAKVLASEISRSGSSFSGRVYVLGERARSSLEPGGFDIAYDRDANTAEDLIRSFGDQEFEGKRLLFVRGDRSVGTVTSLLGKIAKVDEVIVYHTVESTPDDGVLGEARTRMRSSEFRYVCFFSPSGVDSFTRLFSDLDYKLPAAAIGRTTARRAETAGFIVDYVSERATAEDFAAGLAAHIKEIE